MLLASNNLIGGSLPAAGNVIAYNTDAGVFVIHSNDDAIRLNSIYANGDRGIDLNAGEGIPINQPGNNNMGPNDGQNYPVLSSAISSATGTTVVGGLNTVTNAGYIIDFYTNTVLDSDGVSVQGKTYVGSTSVATDASGNATFTVNLASSIPAGTYLVATATTISGAPYGDTSEFSYPIQVMSNSGGGTVTPPTPPTISIGDVSMNEGNSGTTAFTFTITRSGDLSGASSVKFAPLMEQRRFRTTTISRKATRSGSIRTRRARRSRFWSTATPKLNRMRRLS